MSNTRFIAEVCSNHNGSLKRCLDFVRKSKEIGCYAVKFQMFKIDELFSQDILKKSKIHRDRKKWELNEKFIPIIAEECKRQKIKFGCTPFYIDAVKKLEKYVDFFKIGSYEILWTDLFSECAKTGKPVIFSTGMANNNEIKKAYQNLRKNKCKDISIMHCVSEYPANVNNCNLHYINYLRKNFKTKIGWSDHTKDQFLLNFICTNFNVDLVEFHLDLDGKGYEYGPGHCWKPEEIITVINYKYRNNIFNQINFKKTKKIISLKEKAERDWRADPQDGLRPLLKKRKK